MSIVQTSRSHRIYAGLSRRVVPCEYHFSRARPFPDSSCRRVWRTDSIEHGGGHGNGLRHVGIERRRRWLHGWGRGWRLFRRGCTRRYRRCRMPDSRHPLWHVLVRVHLLGQRRVELRGRCGGHHPATTAARRHCPGVAVRRPAVWLHRIRVLSSSGRSLPRPALRMPGGVLRQRPDMVVWKRAATSLRRHVPTGKARRRKPMFRVGGQVYLRHHSVLLRDWTEWRIRVPMHLNQRGTTSITREIASRNRPGELLLDAAVACQEPQPQPRPPPRPPTNDRWTGPAFGKRPPSRLVGDRVSPMMERRFGGLDGQLASARTQAASIYARLCERGRPGVHST